MTHAAAFPVPVCTRTPLPGGAATLLVVRTGLTAEEAAAEIGCTYDPDDDYPGVTRDDRGSWCWTVGGTIFHVRRIVAPKWCRFGHRDEQLCDELCKPRRASRRWRDKW